MIVAASTRKQAYTVTSLPCTELHVARTAAALRVAVAAAALAFVAAVAAPAAVAVAGFVTARLAAGGCW